MAGLERFIQRSIEKQVPRRKRNKSDLAVIREASKAAAAALRNGVEEVQLDIWYE